VLLEQLLGLVGGRYLPTNPVGEHPLVVVSLPQTLGSTGLVLGGDAFLCRTTFALFVLSHFYRCGGRV